MIQVAFDFNPVAADQLRRDGFRSIPRRAAVFRIFDANGNLILLDRTHHLPGRLERFYSESPRPGAVDLRHISDRVEYCTTDSPFESLYLLYLERRRWFPDRYRRMKTFATYPLLAIDPGHRFPRITLARQLRSGVRSFGPFRSRSDAERLKTTLERIFRLRPCEYDIRGNDPYPDCLYFQMETCSKPCNGDIDPTTYRQDVGSAVSLILGDEGEAFAPIVGHIGRLADETRFEEAGQLRIQMERARATRTAVRHPIFDIDRFDFVVVTKASARRKRKIAIIFRGRILRFEEHEVGSIADSLARSLESIRQQRDRGDDEVRYDEFCLSVGFLLRPLRSVRFVPLTATEGTAREVAAKILEEQDGAAGNARGRRGPDEQRTGPE